MTKTIAADLSTAAQTIGGGPVATVSGRMVVLAVERFL
jgi:hypothetical protein